MRAAASGASAGWAHISTSRRTSSSTRLPLSAMVRAPSCRRSASVSSSGSLRWATPSVRSRSSTRRLAAVISQPAGLSGVPSTGQVRLAASTASPERVLDEVEATELRQEQGHQAAPLLSHDLLEGWMLSEGHVHGRVDLDVVAAAAPAAAPRRRRGRAPPAGRTRPCPRSPRRRDRRSASTRPSPTYASRWRRPVRSAPRRRAARRPRARRRPRRTRRTSPSRPLLVLGLVGPGLLLAVADQQHQVLHDASSGSILRCTSTASPVADRILHTSIRSSRSSVETS